MSKIIAFLFVSILMLCHATHGYQGQTHMTINEAAIELLNMTAVSITGAQGDGLDIERLLKTSQWAPDGLKTPLGSKRAIEWLISGGSTEDANMRFLNHFNDPWEILAPNQLNSGGFFNYFDPASRWGILHQPTGPLYTLWYGGDFSWPAALEAYYAGLTGRYRFTSGAPLTTKADRDVQLAKAFQSLGQVMHLVADMGVPAHVRNDIHPFWFIPRSPLLLGPISQLAVDGYEEYALSHVQSGLSVTGLSPVPRSSLWDFFSLAPWYLTNFSGSYSGVRESMYDDLVADKLLLLFGLADFTSMNFLSQDTVFTSDRPPLADKGLTRLAPGSPYWTYTVSTGEKIDHFARDGFWGGILRAFGRNAPNSWTLTLDDDCYADYVKVLPNVAVRYAAGLLKEFFPYELSMRMITGPDVNSGFGLEMKLLKAGSRTKKNPEGDLAPAHVTNATETYGIGGTEGLIEPLGQHQPGGYWFPSGNGMCYDEIRAVAIINGEYYGNEEWKVRYAAASVKGQLHIVPTVPHGSITSGFRAELIQASSYGCTDPKPSKGIEQPTGTLHVRGVADDGTMVDLGESTWPDWPGNTVKGYLLYRIDFDGIDKNGSPLAFTTYYRESLRERFDETTETLEESGSGISAPDGSLGGLSTWTIRRYEGGTTGIFAALFSLSAPQAFIWPSFKTDTLDLVSSHWSMDDSTGSMQTNENTIRNGDLHHRSVFTQSSPTASYYHVVPQPIDEKGVTWHLDARLFGLWGEVFPLVMTADSVLEVDAESPSGNVKLALDFGYGTSGCETSWVEVPAKGPQRIRLGDFWSALAAGGTCAVYIGNGWGIDIWFLGADVTNYVDIPYPTGPGQPPGYYHVPTYSERDVVLRSIKIFP